MMFFNAKTRRWHNESSFHNLFKQKNMVLEVLKKKRINSKNVRTGVVESDTDSVGSGTFFGVVRSAI
jgi:hypothetical protein